jgi:hypothetical protein
LAVDVRELKHWGSDFYILTILKSFSVNPRDWILNQIGAKEASADHGFRSSFESDTDSEMGHDHDQVAH